MRVTFILGLAALLHLAGSGCTTVKFVQKNPYTGESWTVYQHTFSSDTITYCPPYHNAPCRDAVFVDGPPPQSPPPVYAPTPVYAPAVPR